MNTYFVETNMLKERTENIPNMKVIFCILISWILYYLNRNYVLKSFYSFKR